MVKAIGAGQADNIAGCLLFAKNCKERAPHFFVRRTNSRFAKSVGTNPCGNWNILVASASEQSGFARCLEPWLSQEQFGQADENSSRSG